MIVLQCVPVCCSALQCVAVCFSVGSLTHIYRANYDHVAVCYIVLQCVAVRCGVLQCLLSHSLTHTQPIMIIPQSALQPIIIMLQCVAGRYSALQCVALCCSVLQ